MPQAFLTSTLSNTETPSAIAAEPMTETGREKVILTARGSAHAVERVIHELYRVGFAEVREWSKPIPTGRVNEIMRVLTRYVLGE